MPKKIVEWYKNEAIMPKAVWGDSVNPDETGAGPDGIVQPNMPISMRQTTDGPPVMLHEGEATIQQPNGKTQVVPQKDLVDIEKAGTPREMCKGGKYRPMKDGGNYRPMQLGGSYQETFMENPLGSGIKDNLWGGSEPWKPPVGSPPTSPVQDPGMPEPIGGTTSVYDPRSFYEMPGSSTLKNPETTLSGAMNQGSLVNTGPLDATRYDYSQDLEKIPDRFIDRYSQPENVPQTMEVTNEPVQAPTFEPIQMQPLQTMTVEEPPPVEAPVFEPIQMEPPQVMTVEEPPPVEAPTIEPITMEPPQAITVEEPPPVEAPVIEPIQMEQPAEEPAIAEPTFLEQGEQAALEALMSYITGDNAAYENMWNRSLQQFGGQAAAQGAAMRMRMAQAGYTPYEIQTSMQDYYRDLGGQTAQLMGDLAGQAQEIQNQAVSKMLGYGLDIKAHERGMKALELDEERLKTAKEQWGEEFEFRKDQWEDEFGFSQEKYEDQKKYEEFLNSIEYGDDSTVAQAYQDYFGRPITNTAMINDLRIYARSKRQQEIAEGELQLESLRNRIGSENLNYVQDMVNAGYGIDRINSELQSRGIDPLDATEFADMYESTPLGERNWNREMMGVQMLLKEGGQQNLSKAAAMLNTLVPGMDYDFSRSLNEDLAEQFAAGLENMTFYANQFEDWDTAAEAMYQDGTFAMLNMYSDDPIAEAMFKQLKVNVVDEEWETMEQSDFYQGLSADDKTMIQEMYTAKYTGELEWDFAEEYNIVDKDGNFIRSVTGVDAARAAVASDPTNLQMQETGNINVVPRGILSETSSSGGETSAIGSTAHQEARGPEGENVGGYYFYGDKVYKKGEGIDATKDQVVSYESGATDPFDTLANEIIAAGKEINGTENPYYDKILKDRVDLVISGDRQLDVKDDILNDDMYTALINDDRIADGYGTKQKTSEGSVGDEIWYYSRIDGLNEGDLFKRDGVLYKLEQKIVTSDADQFGSRHTKYRLRNLKTGELIEKVAKP